MNRCTFNMAWTECRAEAVEGKRVCAHHAETKCCVCGDPANRECPHTGQFACCAPLCVNCEEFTDTTKASGAWGFMNHTHRRKQQEGGPNE